MTLKVAVVEDGECFKVHCITTVKVWQQCRVAGGVLPSFPPPGFTIQQAMVTTTIASVL